MKRALGWLTYKEAPAFAAILLVGSFLIYMTFYSLKTNFSNASFLNVSYNLNGVQFRDVMVNFQKIATGKEKFYGAIVTIPPANIKVKVESSENLSTTLSASHCKANTFHLDSPVAFCDSGEIVVQSEEDFLKWTKYLDEKKNLGFAQLKNKPIHVLPKD